MFFSNEEKRIMEKFFVEINQNGNDIFVLSFLNGDVIEAKVDTCYETDNGLEENDVNFEEYHACAMKIIKVLVNKSQTLENGKIVEINYHNYPQEIKNSKGDKI